MPVPATLHFDGASQGNPGPSGGGAILTLGDGRVPLEHPLPFIATNNVAEYVGLIEGLRLARSRGVTHLDVRGDSELVVRQMQGRYEVKAAHLRPLRAEAAALAAAFPRITWTHVPRAQNAEADALASRAASVAAARRASLVPYQEWLARAQPAGQSTFKLWEKST